MTATMLTRAAHSAPGLVLSRSSEGPATVVVLRGEADVATLALVERTFDRIIRDGGGPVIVELAETSFIDSGTVRAFSDAARTLGERGRLLRVRSPSRTASVMLELFGLSDLILRDRDAGQ